MEYCGAGSVSDIIRLRNKTVRHFSFERVNGKYGCPAAQGGRAVCALAFGCNSLGVQCLTQPLAMT